MPLELGAIAVFSAIALAPAVAGEAATVVVLVSAGGTAGMLVGAIQVMKLANRNAQRRARGDDADTASARSSQNPEPDMIEGPAAQLAFLDDADQVRVRGRSPDNSRPRVSSWPAQQECKDVRRHYKASGDPSGPVAETANPTRPALCVTSASGAPYWSGHARPASDIRARRGVPEPCTPRPAEALCDTLQKRSRSRRSRCHRTCPAGSGDWSSD